MATFDITNQLYGRTKITSALRFTGEENKDVQTAMDILANALNIHNKNVEKETELWNYYVNNSDIWEKTKTQRDDINNKVTIANAYAFTRTINSYCFGEPVQYTERTNGKQEMIEKLSQYLDYACNMTATENATLSASICGLGYKLALPASKEQYEESGVPFMISKDMIYPQKAFMVYTDDALSEKLMGVYITTYTNEDGNTVDKYNCFTKNFNIVFIEDNGAYKVIPQILDGKEANYYPNVSGKIALTEIERNPFRKGDWEVATDLMILLNRITSDRMDDIDQIIDYILVLTNCSFKTEEEKNETLESRVLELTVANPAVKPTVEILKNAIDQNGIQAFVDYVENKIIEIVGVPTRAERAGGGHDTGTAVKYRNGFRDLENNAGIILPKFEQAELDFLGSCIGYAQVYPDCGISELRPYEIRLKFLRSLNDDVVSSATAFATYVKNGVDFETAFHLSNGVTDPAEATKKVKDAFDNEETLIQLIAKANAKYSTTTTVSGTTEKNTVVDNNNIAE